MKKKSGLADSPFFSTPPSREVFSQSVTIHPNPNSERTEFRTENRSEKRTLELPPLPEKRRTTRYSFEFYEDQILKFKQLKYKAEMAGKRVNLSDFAREAFDVYLKDKGV